MRKNKEIRNKQYMTYIICFVLYIIKCQTYQMQKISLAFPVRIKQSNFQPLELRCFQLPVWQILYLQFLHKEPVRLIPLLLLIYFAAK